MLYVMLSFRKKLILLVLTTLALIAVDANAQSLKDHLQKADRYYQKKDFENALQNYLQVLALDKDHARANFRAGISFLNEQAYSDAVAYLEKAYALQPDVDPNIDYHLATACQEDHQFSKARKHFEAFKKKYKNLARVADQKITECILADSLMRLPVNVTVNPLQGINSAFADFGPLLSPDERTLIFTSNRSTDEYLIKSATNFEDVYISEYNAGQWLEPQKISPNINVKLNEAAMSLAPDGKTLFLYYEEGKGDIYTSTNDGGSWSAPIPLNQFINNPHYRESAACLSADGKKLFFSSNRPGGKGGYDIYVCDLSSKGEWGRPSNLGSTINTKGDEEYPFLHADGVTMYFSSNGHAVIGNHDIFKSTFQDGKWTSPANLGYPVNTRAYEGNFIMTHDKKTGYFTSRRATAPGNADIYTASFSSSADIVTVGTNTAEHGSNRTTKNQIVTVLKGTVLDASTAGPLEATIRLVDNANRIVVSSVETGPSGNFSLVIPHGGNFGVSTDKPGYLFNSMNFNLPPFEKYQEIDTHILMVKAAVGSKVVLKNIFFDVNRSDLKPESRAELENIRDLLVQNPAWRVQINGHTDNVGNAKANLALSLRRAESVVQYLIKEGIASNRLQAKGYGSQMPLVSNDDEEEGRQINRRTEIEIIE